MNQLPICLVVTHMFGTFKFHFTFEPPISVVKTKAVQAKIDQLQKKVIITSTTHRTFSRQHWQLLHQNLVRWQQNLANVQTNLRALEMMQAQQAQTLQQ